MLPSFLMTVTWVSAPLGREPRNTSCQIGARSTCLPGSCRTQRSSWRNTQRAAPFFWSWLSERCTRAAACKRSDQADSGDRQDGRDEVRPSVATGSLAGHLRRTEEVAGVRAADCRHRRDTDSVERDAPESYPRGFLQRRLLEWRRWRSSSNSSPGTTNNTKPRSCERSYLNR